MTAQLRLRVLAAAAGILAAAIALAIPAAADSGFSNGQNYTVTMTAIEGATDNFQGNWDARFAELADGDPTVVAAFNSASRSAAQKQIDNIKNVVTPGSQWNFESRGTVSFRSIAIGQVIVGTSYYGAMPTIDTRTVVIDSRTAQPIMLSDLFINEQTGLDRLSIQTKILLPHSGEVMPDMPGNEPVAENFVNWIPTADGMEIHFAAYQFGIRLAETITVPWSQLADVLAPDLAALAEA